MKHLSIIIILIVVGFSCWGWGTWVGINSAIGSKLTAEQRAQLPYLIDNMELARDTHQQFVDGNNAYSFWVEKHQEWVDIYDEVIPILEASKDAKAYPTKDN